MAHLNRKGPENKGPKTGRMLGKCYKTSEEQIVSAAYPLGKGMGKKKQRDCNAEKGSRSRAYKMID